MQTIEPGNSTMEPEKSTVKPGNSTAGSRELTPGQQSFCFKQKLLLLNECKKKPLT